METIKLQRIGKSVVANASPKTVFKALTEASQLTQWFDEYAEVDPREGGTFKSWGRHRFDGTPDVSQKITSYKQDSELAFEWPFKGKTTIVRIQLTEEGEMTRVELSHEMPDDKGEPFSFEAGDFDYVLLYNLKSFCETGNPMCQADYKKLKDPITFKITIEAPEKDVWHMLTDAKTMDDWISTEAKVDLKVGGQYSYGWSFEEDGVTQECGPRKLIQLEPEKRITTDWVHGGQPETKVVWELEGSGGTTLLKLTHSGFGESSLLPDYEQGWCAFMCILKSTAEGTARVQSL